MNSALKINTENLDLIDLIDFVEDKPRPVRLKRNLSMTKLQESNLETKEESTFIRKKKIIKLRKEEKAFDEIKEIKEIEQIEEKVISKKRKRANSA